MRQQQYEWMLRNRRRADRTLEPLDALTPRIVERAAAGWHRRRAAEQAWAYVAEPAWLADTQPTAIENGVLVVAVYDQACFSLLCRRTRPLGRDLAQLAPAVRGVRFVRGVGHRRARSEVGEQKDS